MDRMTAQAFSDFESFLAGASAPALVGHSLATVVRHDVRTIAETVHRRAHESAAGDPLSALLVVRNKVFDIFFYRVVRYRRAFDFFPRFERALIDSAPPAQRAAIAALFERFPWQEIRPLGDMRDPQDLLLEMREDAKVSTDAFNEDLYRNAQHQILSADRRYSFDDPRVGENVTQYQAQVTEVFGDFVSLIKDALLRREILLANAADSDLVYKDRPKFQIESYLCQLADLAIALFNDDFLEHSARIFSIIRELAESSGLNVEQIEPLQAKSALINRDRLTQYSSSRTGPVLLRSTLPIFPQWRPGPLLHQLEHEGDRDEREVALTILEAYGRDIYPLIVDTLERCDPSKPWHYRRNLVYLLGHLTTNQPTLKERAVQALASQFRRGEPRQFNSEVASALGSIHTDKAVDVLVAKLGDLESSFGKSTEETATCHELLDALIGVQTERALGAALKFCIGHDILSQYEDAFATVALPDGVRSTLTTHVRRELRKMRFSFSLLGDQTTARSMLLALGSAEFPDVAELCDEVSQAMPSDGEIARAVAILREKPAPPPPMAYDKALHRLLADRNLPEAFSYAFEAGLSGCLDLTTAHGVVSDVWLRKGEIWIAKVPQLFTGDEEAFYWTFTLDRDAIDSVLFDPERQTTDPRAVSLPTPDLIREGLFRAKHVQQIIGGILSPESRFLRRTAQHPEGAFGEFDRPQSYQAVWESLSDVSDLKAIAASTGLHDHEIYRVLFDMLRLNLIVIVSESFDRQFATIDDGLTALKLFVRRIGAHPTYFQTYRAAADVCEYLAQEASDETIRSVTLALHTFLINAYNLRKVLSEQSLEFCSRTIDLASVYLRTRTDTHREELLEYVDIYLPEEDRWPAPPQDEASFIQSVLEQIENIDGMNDPFDTLVIPPLPALAAETSDPVFDAMPTLSLSVGDIYESGVSEARPAMAFGELLAEASSAYVKPLKDFIREVERSLKSGRDIPSAWLDSVASALELLQVAAERASEHGVHEAVSRLDRAFRQQRELGIDVLTPAFCSYVLTEYQHLAELYPSAFALELPDEELRARKEALLIKFLLRQVPEFDDALVNRVLFSGLSSFDDISQTPPEELAEQLGVDRRTANKIFMKFYQYVDLYYHPGEPETRAKFLGILAISLNALREIQVEVEQISQQDEDGRARKEALLFDRQRALWAIFTLLCLQGELDLIERLQRTVFEQRIKLLEDYLRSFSDAAFPMNRAPGVG